MENDFVVLEKERYDSFLTGEWRGFDFEDYDPFAYASGVEYAREIYAGLLPVGPYIWNAVIRYLGLVDDFNNKKGKWIFDRVHATRFEKFCKDVLIVPDKGIDFRLFGFQRFVIENMLCWKHRVTKRRKHQYLYLEGGRGFSKSALAVAMGLYLALEEYKNRQAVEIYVAATSAEQASVCFGMAFNMCESAKAKEYFVKNNRDINIYGRNMKNCTQISDIDNQNFLKRLAFEKEGMGSAGKSATMFIIDEYCDSPTAGMLEQLEQNQRAIDEPLKVICTNSGFYDTPCRDEHERCVRLLDGGDDYEDDGVFPYICDLDPSDVPKAGYPRREVWIKTHPSLPVTPNPDFISRRTKESIVSNSKHASTMRYQFCQWQDKGAERDSWFDDPTAIQHVFMREKSFESLGLTEVLRNCPVALGLDMAFSGNLVSLCLLYDIRSLDLRLISDEFVDFSNVLTEYIAIFHHFKPEKQYLNDIRRVKNVPYESWVDRGYLKLVKGSIERLEHMVEEIAYIYNTHTDIMGMGLDAFRWNNLYDQSEQAELPLSFEGQGSGIPIWKHPMKWTGTPWDNAGKQKLTFPKSLEFTEDALLTGKLILPYNPLARSAITQAQVEHKEKDIDSERVGTTRVGLRVIDREARFPSDPAVALIVAMGVLKLDERDIYTDVSQLVGVVESVDGEDDDRWWKDGDWGKPFSEQSVTY